MILRRNSALIALIILLLAEVLLTAYLYRNWQAKLQIHQERQVQSVQTAYQAAVDSFKLASEIYVNEVIRQPELLALLKQGLMADSEPEQALARGLLYRSLWPSYAALSESSLRQMQFHQPDGRSYLRFLQAEAYGDDLLAFRPSVREVLEHRQPLATFEAGLSLTGFRYVFPLDWQEHNLGSVELSVPFRAVQEVMRQLDPTQDYYLFLQRSIIEPVVPSGSLVLYRPTLLHPDFLIEDPNLALPDSPPPPSQQAQALNRQLSGQSRILAALDAGQMTTQQAQLDRQTWAITFLPIQGLDGRTLAYIAAYTADAFAAALRQDFVINWLLGSALLAAILLLVYRLLASREALLAEKAYQHAITESMGEGLYALDRQGQFTFVNPRAEELLDCKGTEIQGVSESKLVSWQRSGQSVAQPLTDLANALRSYEGEAQLVRPDGSLLDVEVTSRPLYKQGVMSGSVTLLRDISERKRTEERLLLAASVFSSAQEGIIITQPDASILMVNDAFETITGYSFAEVEGKNPRLLQSGRQQPGDYLHLWQSLLEQGLWQGELWNRRKDGKEYLQATTITAVTDAKGKPLHYVGLVSDITQLKQHQDELEFLAHYDPLTHLPNLVHLQQQLEALMQASQDSGQSLLVGKLDLDDFNAINDRWGHAAGDQLLKAVAERLKRLMGDSAFVARLGGDEFAFVVQLPAELEQGLQAVKALLNDSKRAFYIQGQLIKITASIGLTFYPQNLPANADQLLRQADQAMYQAKQAGKKGYQVFDAELDHRMRGQYETLMRLTEALAEDEFVLFYQPKVNLLTGQVIGVEALIRWQHPERGLLAPGQFLSVLDQQPLEVEVSHWVIRQALQQLASWKQAGIHLPVSVNICAQHLQQKDFVEQIDQHLSAQPTLESQDLQLEILESSVLGDIDHACQVIHACRGLGVTFALDDFGTGYSSLAYLKHLPADLIKIDQSFVRDMLDDPDDLAILQGVQGLAKAFERDVLAEGVETYQHAELLVELGCVQAQGYGIARPMPAEAMPEWLLSWQAKPWRFSD